MASCGDDGAITLWDAATGTLLHTLRRDRPYERLNIAGVHGLTETQKAKLRSLGAHESVVTTQRTPNVRKHAPARHIPSITNPPPTHRDQKLVRSLSYQPTSFVGRTAELEQIDGILAEQSCRLMTLLGPGGMGKTRLAVEVAARQSNAFADGTALVPLAPITSANQIVSAIGDVLQLSFAGQSDPMIYLLASLRERRMLLVLDNFEHVMEGVAIVDDILAYAPQVTILVTSRERLRLRAEWLFDVEGLSFPSVDDEAAVRKIGWSNLVDYSAVELFAQRAQQLQPRFLLSEETIVPVLRICQHVEGMPLAIELAAASVRSVPVVEIERQIATNLIELQSDLRDLPARHRSLRAVFDHSWNLLSEEEQVVFRRLAVFRGGWTQEAAEQIIQTTYALLLALLDKSLMYDHNELDRATHTNALPEGHVHRFFMLEPVREYALEKLAADPDAEDIRRRHAAYFAMLGEDLFSRLAEFQEEEIDRQLAREHDNFRAGLHWALHTGEGALGLRLGGAYAEFWRIYGHIIEGRRWLEALLAAFPTPLDERLPVVHRAFQFAMEQGDYQRAADLAEEGIGIARALEQQDWIGDFLALLGNIAFNQSDIAQATALFEEALQLFRVLDKPRGVANALFNLGRIAGFGEGDLVRARSLVGEAITLWQQYGDSFSTVLALLHQGTFAAMAEDAAQAIRDGVAALELAWPNRYMPMVGYCFSLLAIPAIMQHQQERGVTLFATATQWLNELGVVMPPAEQDRYEHWLRIAREGLDPARFETAWAAGLALSSEAAVRYALDNR